MYHSDFQDRPFLAHDAPGWGATTCEDLSNISIPFLVKTAQAVLHHAGTHRFHLVGHSMGGLTSLMLANEGSNRVIGFTDIEGNISPEDCFLGRQIATYPSHDAESFLTLSNAPGIHHTSLALCTQPAFYTKYAPAPFMAFSVNGRLGR